MDKNEEKKKATATHCYTYEINMIVQILAEDEKTAREQLDKQGGYVTRRDVALADSVALFSGKK